MWERSFRWNVTTSWTTCACHLNTYVWISLHMCTVSHTCVHGKDLASAMPWLVQKKIQSLSHNLATSRAPSETWIYVYFIHTQQSCEFSLYLHHMRMHIYVDNIHIRIHLNFVKVFIHVYTNLFEENFSPETLLLLNNLWAVCLYTYMYTHA